MPASTPLLDRVLLTNDDGIDAPGLAVLEAAAAEIAREVWVVAPEHDQSGTSHSISLHHPVRLSRRGKLRFGVTGTPGDCAVMGVRHLMADQPPQLVLSGVNRGANLGIETVFSGTVGGAMTGMMFGIPSIALSQAFTDRAQVRWDTARALVPGIVRRLLELGWGVDTCLNVNIPDLPLEEVGPLTLARQGPGLVETIDATPHTDPRGLTYFWLAFQRGAREQEADTDVAVLGAGRIAVTPIRYDRTDEAAFAELARRMSR